MFVSTVPPGQILREMIEALGMPQAELALRMGRPTKTINGIIKNRVAITVETALQLERVLGLPANFWNNREQSYRQALARQEEEKELAGQVAWLDKLPVKAMVDRGWVQGFDNESQQVRELLKFFGVATPAQWYSLWISGSTTVLRDHSSKAFGATAAWLRKGEIEAHQLECRPYNAKKFREALSQFRLLTAEPLETSLARMIATCASTGVAVTSVTPLPPMQICGASRWLIPHKAVLQLSLNLDTEEQFWFSFLHLAGHIFLHGKRDVFFETEHAARNRKEAEADTFAADLLIPARRWWRFVDAEGYHLQASIQNFAASLGISPGLVVSRLQREGLISKGDFNQLKRRLTWPVRPYNSPADGVLSGTIRLAS